MGKLFLLILISAGAFFLMAMFLPTHVWKTAFEVGGRNIPYIAIGVLLCCYIGYKKVAS